VGPTGLDSEAVAVAPAGKVGRGGMMG